MTEVTTSFVAPYALESNPDVVGVSLHDIAKSLGARFNDVKVRFLSLKTEGEFGSETAITVQQEIQEVTGHGYTREVDSFFLPLDDARFFVTQYQNQVGRAYCRFLIQRENILDATDEALKDPTTARRFAVALMARAEAQIALEKSQAVVAHVTKSLTTSQVRNGGLTREKNKMLQDLADLKDQGGEGQLYRSVKGMMKTSPGCIGNLTESKAGIQLRKLSLSLGLEVRKVSDPNWGTVNIYHHDAWSALADLLSGKGV